MANPKGRKLNIINKESYVVYDFPISNYNLSDAIEIANTFLYENIEVFNGFKKTGGRSEFYFTVKLKNKFVFVIPPKLFKDCSDLGISLGVEIYPESQK